MIPTKLQLAILGLMFCIAIAEDVSKPCISAVFDDCGDKETFKFLDESYCCFSDWMPDWIVKVKNETLGCKCHGKKDSKACMTEDDCKDKENIRVSSEIKYCCASTTEEEISLTARTVAEAFCECRDPKKVAVAAAKLQAS